MASTHANVCNVMGTREEIMILFGSHQAWNPEKTEVKVTLTNRMILNPYAAKRLAALLSIGLTEYEKRFGELVL